MDDDSVGTEDAARDWGVADDAGVAAVAGGFSGAGGCEVDVLLAMTACGGMRFRRRFSLDQACWRCSIPDRNVRFWLECLGWRRKLMVLSCLFSVGALRIAVVSKVHIRLSQESRCVSGLRRAGESPMLHEVEDANSDMELF